jgi:hypothetical protein
MRLDLNSSAHAREALMDTSLALQSTSLAPAAGSGIGRKLADMLLDDPEFLPCLKAAFMDGLKAETWYYDAQAKQRCSAVDYKTRLNSAVSLLSHMEGDPIKRVIHQHLGGDPASALQDELVSSPALRTALRRRIEAAERAAKSGSKPVNGPLVDGEAFDV